VKRLGEAWTWNKGRFERAEAWRTSKGSLVLRFAEPERRLEETSAGRIAPVYQLGRPVTLDEARPLLQAVGARRYQLGAAGEGRAHLGRCVLAGGLLASGYLAPAIVATADGDRVGLLVRTSGGIVEREARTVVPAWWRGNKTTLSSWLWTETDFWE
jgi:hypothetical protein